MSGFPSSTVRSFDAQSARNSSNGAPPFVASLSCTRISVFSESTAALISRRQFVLKKSASRNSNVKPLHSE
eukprot:243744-Prymnesium_polylepis.1